jgi:hypothetical protein
VQLQDVIPPQKYSYTGAERRGFVRVLHVLARVFGPRSQRNTAVPLCSGNGATGRACRTEPKQGAPMPRRKADVRLHLF